MGKIKVIMVLTDKNIGGAGRAALNLFSCIDRNAFQIQAVIPKGSLLKKEIEGLELSVFEAPMEDKSFDIKSLGWFLKLYRREAPDIVHTHASLSARIAAKLCGIKVVFTRHWVGKMSVSAPAKLLNNMLCDSAIGVSEAAREAIISTGVAREKTAVIYNGVRPLRKYTEQEKLEARRRYGIPENVFLIGTAARLEEVKGHIYLLKALEELNDTGIMLALAGEGSLRDMLKEYAGKPELDDRVFFLGFVEDMEGFMNMINLHVLPSLEEAFPLSILEAMSAGCPCIATDSGGAGEIIIPGETGMLAPTRDVKALSAVIRRAAAEPEELKKWADNAFEVVNSRFTPEAMARETERLYRKLLEEIKKEADTHDI